MTLAERKHAAELCRAHWPGKVVVGVSSTAVADCLELIEHAATQITTANKVSKHAEAPISLHASALREGFVALEQTSHLYKCCITLFPCHGVLVH